MSPDINNHDDTARKERSAYNKMMNAMLTLEAPSRMKVLGAVAIMVKPAVPEAPTPPAAPEQPAPEAPKSR